MLNGRSVYVTDSYKLYHNTLHNFDNVIDVGDNEKDAIQDATAIFKNTTMPLK